MIGAKNLDGGQQWIETSIEESFPVAMEGRGS